MANNFDNIETRFLRDVLESLPVSSSNQVVATNTTASIIQPARPEGYATEAQGVLADTALQPGEAATPEQGDKADTAMQPVVYDPQGKQADAFARANQTGTQTASTISDFAQNVPIYATAVGIAALNIPPGINAFRTNGYHAAGDWGAALYREKNVLEAGTPGDLTSNSTTRRWALAMPSVNPVMYGAKGDYYENGTDDYEALQDAIDSGLKVLIPHGDFGTSHPLIVRQAGQIIEGFGGGYGYGTRAEALPNYQANSRIVAFGAAEKRVMTRRLYRASVADPNDAPMSAVIDVEAEGVQVNDLTIWLDCDYSDTSPTNFGAEWDIGLFVGCRPGFQSRNVQVLGYFRKGGMIFDVTRAAASGSDIATPQLLDYDGNPLPTGSLQFGGGDGTQLVNPYVRGSLGPACGVIGSVNGGGGTYYDAVSDANYPDLRGASGFSDFNVYGGRFYSTFHHSGRRVSDPTTSPLSWDDIDNDDIYSPSALTIDGWAATSGSTTHSQGAIRGMCFFGTRFASSEKYRVRLGLCDEIFGIGRTWIESGPGPYQNTAGATINVNDYANQTYGHICGHSTKTGYVELDHVVGGYSQSWLRAGKYGASSAAGVRRIKSMLLETDTADLNSQQKAILDIRDTGAVGERAGVSINAFKPKIRFEDVSGSALDFDIVVDGNTFEIRTGNAATDTALATSLVKISGNTGAVYPSANGSQNLGQGDSAWNRAYIKEIRLGGDALPRECAPGTGSPEGVVTAPVGSTYRRTDGGAGTSFYVKESGGGNTGWVGK